MQLVVTITGIVLVVILYLLGYFVMFKAKSEKACLIGGLIVFAAIAVSVITIVLAKNFKSHDNSIKEQDNSSQSDQIIVEIPPNFESGFLIASNGRSIYAAWGKEKENSTNEKLDNSSLINALSWFDLSNRLDIC